MDVITEARLPEESASQDIFQSAHSVPASPTPPPSPSILNPPGPSTQAPIRPLSSSILPPLSVSPPPADARPVVTLPGTSSAPSISKRRVTAQDVYELQVKVLQGNLVQQQKEMKKLDLQIQLLEKLNKETTLLNSSPIVSQLWGSMV